MLCLCVFKMYLLAYGWCLHTFFFRDKGKDSATQSESLWTLQINVQSKKDELSKPMYFDIFLKHIVTKIESSVQLVGFVFGSLS